MSPHAFSALGCVSEVAGLTYCTLYTQIAPPGFQGGRRCLIWAETRALKAHTGPSSLPDWPHDLKQFAVPPLGPHCPHCEGTGLAAFQGPCWDRATSATHGTGCPPLSTRPASPSSEVPGPLWLRFSHLCWGYGTGSASSPKHHQLSCAPSSWSLAEHPAQGRRHGEQSCSLARRFAGHALGSALQ